MDGRNKSVGTQIIVKPDNTIAVEDFEIRNPGRGEVLIETVSTLISAGTELGTQEQKRTNDFAVVVCSCSSPQRRRSCCCSALVAGVALLRLGAVRGVSLPLDVVVWDPPGGPEPGGALN